MVDLRLDLNGLELKHSGQTEASEFSSRDVLRQPWDWDLVVKSSHPTNCWYQRACNFNLYVKDGIVLREEQAGNYPRPNDPAVPDANPRGCQKGVCYAQRMYDPTRVKYPLKRVGPRGSQRWQKISWDQALSEISDILIDVLTTDGPEVIIQGGGTRVHSQGTEGMAYNAFFEALGCSLTTVNGEIGDDHEGVAITLGKTILADSADNWFHADVILVWGGNPAYTNIPNFHYIAEARYKGTRVIAISPDYNASAIHADLWVPVNVGSDGALALSMAQVIIRERLYRADFVREQTDLPLLVRLDNGRLVREKDLKPGGRDDIFYFYDEVSRKVLQAPRKSLALDRLAPALEGEFEIRTLSGIAKVAPVFELLRRHLDESFDPQKAEQITGVSAPMIERLARKVASAGGVVNISSGNWGKFYHGDLIERAILLVFALCGHLGRKGASFSAFPALHPDTALGALERRGHQLLLSAAANDPRYATWREDGYTTEMILYEYGKESVASGAIAATSMVQFIHGGVLELSKPHNSWDPHLKRPVGEYLNEALEKGWQVAVPAPDKDPKVLFQVGGNFLRRGRATKQLQKTLLPKLKLLVTVDWRMSTTGLHSDYILPACGWYERTSTNLWSCTQFPYMQISNKATEPLYDSLSEWGIFVRLARKMTERAQQRGVLFYRGKDGKERTLEKLETSVTCGSLYDEDDEEGLARDAYLNTGNVEQIGWEEVRERGFAAYTGLGSAMRSIGNACDINPGDPLVPLTWHTEKKQPYPTLTRRIQFYIDHDWYLELGEHLPTHKDCPKAGGDYPLQVTGGHARWSIHSDWIDDSIILALQRGEPLIYLSANDARAREVRDGDFVEVHNDVGDFAARAVVSPGVRDGQVIIYHGWENYQFDQWHHFKSVMASPMNPIELVGGYGHIRPDPVICSPGMSDRDTRVEIRKANEPRLLMGA
ncbi:MAG: molybdopterin-dependent oxidoreductase [Deltaproteobacteria bacterium]|nr:molybdopterin-dependent oxidoreductase [Deltaproteobacteria bacterium]